MGKNENVHEGGKGVRQMIADGDICTDCRMSFDDQGPGYVRTCEFCVDEIVKKYKKQKEAKANGQKKDDSVRPGNDCR